MGANPCLRNAPVSQDFGVEQKPDPILIEFYTQKLSYISPSGNGYGVSRYENGRPKFESDRFLSQLTRNPGRFLTA